MAKGKKMSLSAYQEMLRDQIKYSAQVQSRIAQNSTNMQSYMEQKMWAEEQRKRAEAFANQQLIAELRSMVTWAHVNYAKDRGVVVFHPDLQKDIIIEFDNPAEAEIRALELAESGHDFYAVAFQSHLPVRITKYYMDMRDEQVGSVSTINYIVHTDFKIET